VTQYWEKMDASLEVTQGKLIADACKEAGVEHLIYSSLEDTRTLNQVRFNICLGFDTFSG